MKLRMKLLAAVVGLVGVFTCAADESAVLADHIAWFERAAGESLSRAERRMSDGTPVYAPQGSCRYEAFWLRDYVMMLEGGLIPAERIVPCARIFLNAVSGDGAGVDCVKFDGTPVYMPGYGTMGEKPVLDGGPYTVKLAYESWRRTQDPLFTSDETLALLGRVLAAVPHAPGGVLAWIDPSRDWERCPFGFTDTVRKRGECLFSSVLTYEARKNFAELLEASGRRADAARERALAERIAQAVDERLWDESEGLYRAATDHCREPDVWGSAYAVWTGLADVRRAGRIAAYFNMHFDELVQRGQVRQLPAGVYWEQSVASRDSYQNGAYWGTASGWFAWTLSLVDRTKAIGIFSALREDCQSRGANEWVFGDRAVCGDYLSTLALPLQALRRLSGSKGACPGNHADRKDAVAPAAVGECARYGASWESLDKRPMPQWWADAKFGIFVHWGPYSVPAYAPLNEKSVYECYAEWYHGKLIQGRPKFLAHHAKHYGSAPYGNLAAAFKAENFDAAEWADLFRRAGARYTVLTSKHHDGYALWPSRETPYYNSVALGPGRDLVGEFSSAMKRAGLKCGFYYSLMEYANPAYTNGDLKVWSRTMNHPQMKDLVERYQADVLWADGEWDHSDADWLSCEFLAWLYNESSVRDSVIVNDRWGKNCTGRHGGYFTTEYGNGTAGGSGTSVHPWEECRGIGRSFGYNRYETAENYMSREACVETLARVVAGGGNLLLNVGPTDDGRIPAIMQDRLLAMGSWLKVNGEAVYASRKARASAAEKRVYVTSREGSLYAMDFRGDGKPLTIRPVGRVAEVGLLGSAAPVRFSQTDDAVTIHPPALAGGDAPCEFAWTYRLAVDMGKKTR